MSDNGNDIGDIWFSYQASPRRFALEMLGIAVVFPSTVLLILYFTPIVALDDPVRGYVKWGAVAIGVLLFLVACLPNLFKTGRFSFVLGSHAVSCVHQDSETLNYRLNISDLKEVFVQRHIGSDTHYWYFLVTRDDRRYVIPYAYKLSPLQVVKVIQKQLPSLPIRRN